MVILFGFWHFWIIASDHSRYCDSHNYKVYRVQSSVWGLPNYGPPTPSPPSVSSPRNKGGGGGVHTRRVGGGGVNISEDARLCIGLLQYNPSTVTIVSEVDPGVEGQ